MTFAKTENNFSWLHLNFPSVRGTKYVTNCYLVDLEQDIVEEEMLITVFLILKITYRMKNMVEAEMAIFKSV